MSNPTGYHRPMPDLWSRASTVTAAALASGALAPIRTRTETIVDGGIRFAVAVVNTLAAKESVDVDGTPATADPFADPDPRLVVVDRWPPAHRVLLNKYPVYPDHLLIVTRPFVPQDGVLDRGDFDALTAALADADGLLFYNGGTVAGSSQPHRHLQLVRTPLTGDGGRFPTEAAIRAGSAPFPVFTAPMPARAADAHAAYLRLMDDAACTGGRRPWNLLATRELLAVVPRTRERAAGRSINALGFAGSLLVKDDEALGRVKRTGPVAMLRHVTR